MISEDYLKELERKWREENYFDIHLLDRMIKVQKIIHKNQDFRFFIELNRIEGGDFTHGTGHRLSITNRTIPIEYRNDSFKYVLKHLNRVLQREFDVLTKGFRDVLQVVDKEPNTPWSAIRRLQSMGEVLDVR